MSKKLFIILFVLFSLSACAESPGPQLSSLPEDYFLEKERERGLVEHLPDSREELEYLSPTTEFPEGDFILLRSLPQKMYELSLYIDNKNICTWERGIYNPLDFKEKETLYIAEINCTPLGDEVVSWDVNNVFAIRSLYGEFVSHVDIWYVTGSQYFLLSNQ